MSANHFLMNLFEMVESYRNNNRHTFKAIEKSIAVVSFRPRGIIGVMLASL